MSVLEQELPVKVVSSTLVEVRPLPLKKWHNKIDRESFTRPKILEALYDEGTGGYATGLTEAEALEYGKKVGFDLSSNFDQEKAHPTWSAKAFQIRLENRTMMFDSAKPMDFIKIKMMKASRFVANSMKEFDEGKYPHATHVIFDETARVADQATKVTSKKRAYAYLDKMTTDDMAGVVQILSKKTVRNRSADFLNVEVDTLIEENPVEFLRVVEMGRAEVEVRARVLEALDKNVLTKEAGAVYYMGEQIAFDYEDAVTWFKDPNNQKMKVLILEKLNK